MTHLHQLADAGLQGRTRSPSVPAIPPAHLHRIFNTPVVDRFDGPARHRIIHGEPSLSQRILVRLVWLVCCAYCVAIWLKLVP